MRHAPVLGLVSLLALAATPGVAHAEGPCTNDIAQMRRQLASMPGLGAPISEPGAGQTVGRQTAQSGAAAGSSGTSGTSTAANQQQPGGASLTHGGSPGTVGGTAGAVGAAVGRETQNALTSGQIATSAEDVRRQSEGKPTVAQQAARQASGASPSATDTTSSDRVSQAKAALQRAVDLNARNDNGCKGALNDARRLMPQH